MSEQSTHLAPRDVRSWRPASEAIGAVATKDTIYKTRPLALPAATLPLAAIISRSEMNTMAGSRRHED